MSSDTESVIIDLTQPQVMGVLNVTADSFSDGGQFLDTDVAIRHAESMLEQGASIVDVGGESTRPGAQQIPDQEQLDRVLPVITAVANRVDVAISIDTSSAAVMRAAAAAGAVMINDVYALRREGALDAAAETGCAVCLMHMQGEPRGMQDKPTYDDVIGEISDFLDDRVMACLDKGISRDRIVVDPGFGFGKTDSHNIELLAKLDRLQIRGLPILVGLSRKRTLGRLTGRNVEDRLAAGIAAAVIAFQRGATIVRTHDVAATVDALRIATAVREAQTID
jgi:dihydropteroate synthase